MKLIDVLKGQGYNPNRGPDGRFASGDGGGASGASTPKKRTMRRSPEQIRQRQQSEFNEMTAALARYQATSQSLRSQGHKDVADLIDERLHEAKGHLGNAKSALKNPKVAEEMGFDADDGLSEARSWLDDASHVVVAHNDAGNSFISRKTTMPPPLRRRR